MYLKEEELEEKEEEHSIEEESAEEQDEEPQVAPPKRERKHIIKVDEEDDQDNEPSVSVFPSKDKEKFMIDEDSEEDQDDIDAEIKAVATRATKTTEAKKSLLYIIAEIIYEETATTTLPATIVQDFPIKSPSRTPWPSSKRKGAQPSRDAVVVQASEESEPKKAKSD